MSVLNEVATDDLFDDEWDTLTENRPSRPNTLNPDGDPTGPSIVFDPSSENKRGSYKRYDETRCYQQSLRCMGGCCCICVFLSIFSWFLVFFYLAQPTHCFRARLEAEDLELPFDCTAEVIAAEKEHWELLPAYAKSLLWSSIAHHTKPYQDWSQVTAPPPPPLFL